MKRKADHDKNFSGSIAALYEALLVPLIFQPYADDLARRIAGLPGTDLLEIAAGTGVVTRALAASSGFAIVATDLNPAMIEEAARVGTPRPVRWQPADAMALPFADASFDVVACQFGAMFFPDKARAFAETRRVLRPGGTFGFNVWDRIEGNDFADVVTDAMATMFPDDPPRFLARTPHGHHDTAVLARALADGGFDEAPQVETVIARSRAATARIPAVAYCQGTPLRNEIEARAPDGLEAATAAAEAAIARRFGPGPVEGRIQAHVITVRRGA